MIGSEDTLGMICNMTMEIHHILSHTLAVTCAFEYLHSAAKAVVRYWGVIGKI